MKKRLVGVGQLAEYLDLSKDKVYSLKAEKKIPYIKIGKCLKFDLEAIDKWIKKKTEQLLRIWD